MLLSNGLTDVSQTNISFSHNSIIMQFLHVLNVPSVSESLSWDKTWNGYLRLN